MYFSPLFTYMGCCEDYLTCDIAFNAVMPLSRDSTCGRYSRIKGVTDDVLNSLKNLSLEKDSQPNYVRFELEVDNGEFRFPPTTHFIATVQDLTDMPDYGSEDIDGIDDDADKEQGQDPPVIRCGTATPSYDV